MPPRSGRSPARRGYEFERRVRTQLEADGYHVIRPGASQGPADLLAFKIGQVLFVQCKLGGRLDPDPWNQLIDLAATLGHIGIPVMAEKRDGQVWFWELLTRKTGQHRASMERWHPDQAAAS